MKLLGFVLLYVLSCTRQTQPGQEVKSKQDVDLVSKGKAVYMSNCIACHNADPTKDGPLGPAINGSSHELLEARILRAEYPPNYTPKRNTKAMVPLPQLKSDITPLHTYLNSLSVKSR